MTKNILQQKPAHKKQTAFFTILLPSGVVLKNLTMKQVIGWREYLPDVKIKFQSFKRLPNDGK